MNYLNAKERNAVCSLLLSVGVAEDIVRSKHTTKEESRRLKKIQEWSEKYMAELFKRVPTEHDRIIRLFNDSECKLSTKSAVKDKYTQIATDTLDDLIEVAVMDKCKNCEGLEYEGCKLFKLQQDCNVFMVQDREGYCPYAYDESEGE